MANAEDRTRFSNELKERAGRWNRAAAWARGQSFPPSSYGVPEAESRAIEALRDRILEIGEDAAEDEYFEAVGVELDEPPKRHLRAV